MRTRPVGPRGRTAGAAGWRRPLALAALGLAASSCGGEPTAPPDPPAAEATVVRVTAVQGAGQRIWSRRRSPEPFRVRALDEAGRPVPDARVRFTVEGLAGRLTQPVAVTDDAGVAATWLLEAPPGEGALVAEAGAGRAALPFVVLPAPGSLTFAPGTGAAGLPGLPHPDSVVRVRVLDTEGVPMAGQEVWFAGPAELSRWRDTTDAGGWAGTRIRRTRLSAGPGNVFAFPDGFPNVLGSTSRRVVPAAERVVLVSVDGLRADALERWRPPTLLRLAREGAYASRARTVVPSLTTPAHLSLLSGVGPAGHGVWHEELAYTEEMARLDPPFRHALHRGMATAAFASAEGPLGRLEEALACRLALGLDSLTLVAASAAAVVDAASGALADPSRRMVFVHLPDPDIAGHEHGFASAAYGEAVLGADAALARIVAAVPSGTLVVVTSDHGGGGAWGEHLHGSAHPADVEVPLLLWGARAAPVRLEGGSILDVAPTLLWALGMAPPARYEGRVLLEGFR